MVITQTHKLFVVSVFYAILFAIILGLYTAQPYNAAALADANVHFSSESDLNTIDQPFRPPLNPALLYKNPCPPPYMYCRDGTCAQSLSDCPIYQCPNSSYICPDGACSTDFTKCPNTDTGCPFDTPIRCPGMGNCVKLLRNCERPNCPNERPNACSDGTCRQICDKQSNGCKVGQFRCFDSTCVFDIRLCTSQDVDVDVGFPNACPPGANFKCPNGLCVENRSVCPPPNDPSPCPVDKPVLCASGLCTTSTTLCPLVKPCPSLEFTRCDNGECKLSANNDCPAFQSCPDGWIRCKQTNFPSIAILDGICAPDSDHCLISNGCPLATPYKCLMNGRCVVNQLLCSDQLPTSNGCPPTTPFKCWNGACVSDSMSCLSLNNCPTDTSLRCTGSGRCVADLSLCTTTDTSETCLMKDNKFRCSNGDCVLDPLQCLTPLACPVYAPVRCANGECKAFSAQHRAPQFGLSLQQLYSLTCPPVLQCPNNYIICGDGKCVESQDLCPSTPYTCTPGLFRCFDGTCRPAADKCGLSPAIDEITQLPDVDKAGNPVWVTSTTKLNCPRSSPSICPNGACVNGAQCDSPMVLTKNSQVLCFDGSYRETFNDCIDFAKKVNMALLTLKSEFALACVDYCPNGQCLLQGQTVQQSCGIVPACNIGQWRCFDGSCSDQPCTALNITRRSCNAGEELNVDGRCREIGKGIQYDGCGAEIMESYHCSSRECASGPDVCIIAGKRIADEYAQLLLSNSDYANWKNHNIISHYLSFPPPSHHNKLVSSPNTFPFNTFSDKSDITELYEPCTTNCSSPKKLTPTAILYDPSQPSQEYILEPLSNLVLKIYSGIMISDQTKDMNIYIHPVGENVYFNASNRVTYSRRDEFGETLTSAQTILSPIFSCSVGNVIVEPFAIGLELTALVDLSTISPRPDLRDICLARLRRFPVFNYATWECLFSNEQRLNQNGQYSPKQHDSDHIQVFGTIPSCFDPDLSSSATTPTIISNSFTVLQTVDDPRAPAVYAFIYSPIAIGQIYNQSQDSFLHRNIIWILFVFFGGLLLILFLLYITMFSFGCYTNPTQTPKQEHVVVEIVEMEKTY